MKPSLIHLNVDKETKSRWVRASRKAGLKLSDYIQNSVEEYMKNQLTTLKIPDNIKFDDLKLSLDPDGNISFDSKTIAAICLTNSIDIRVFEQGPETNLSELINNWYRAHLANGGDVHPVMESMISEVNIENSRGQFISYKSGKA